MLVYYNSKCYCVDMELKAIDLMAYLKSLNVVPSDGSYLTVNGRIISYDENIERNAVVRVELRLVGGKGGFGSMLRAIGAQIEKTTNREACRDLSGRRLRDINEEKRLKRWLSKKSERERLAQERKQQKIERLKHVPKHEFHDPQYDKERSELVDRVYGAVDDGLKKRPMEESQFKPVKKMRAAANVGLEGLVSDSSDEEDGSTSSAEFLDLKPSIQPDEDKDIGQKASSSRDFYKNSEEQGSSSCQDDYSSGSTHANPGLTHENVNQEKDDSSFQKSCDEQQNTGSCGNEEQRSKESSVKQPDNSCKNGAGDSLETADNCKTQESSSKEEETSDCQENSIKDSDNITELESLSEKQGACDKSHGESTSQTNDSQETSSKEEETREFSNCRENSKKEKDSKNELGSFTKNQDKSLEESSGETNELQESCSTKQENSVSNSNDSVKEKQADDVGNSTDQKVNNSNGSKDDSTKHDKEEEDKSNNETEKITPILINLEGLSSVSELEDLGLEGLKQQLVMRELKCGGTLQQRAQRLWSIRGLKPSQIDKKLKAKPTTKK